MRTGPGVIDGPSAAAGDPVAAPAGGTWLRAALAATAAVLLALAGHVAGGMAPPGVGVLVGAAVVLTPASGWLLRRERRLGVIVVALAAAELGLHAVFTLLGSGTPGTAMLLCGPGAPGMHHALVHGTGRLLAAHALGTVLLGGWVRLGERAAFGLARALRLRLAGLLRPLTRLTAPATARLRARPCSPVLTCRRAPLAWSLRGPPPAALLPTN